jgi:hypothetical protein
VVNALNILRSRALRVAILLLQAVWINAIVPGHRRGEVALPGETCAAYQPHASSCCAEMAEIPPARHKAPRSGDPASHCAICHFAAALATPPAITLSPPPLTFLESIEPLVVERATAVLFVAPYDGRAPPDVSFHFV